MVCIICYSMILLYISFGMKSLLRVDLINAQIISYYKQINENIMAITNLE